MTTTTEDNLAVVRRWAELVNAGDIDAAVECLAPDFSGYFTGMPEAVHGPEGFKQMYLGFIKPSFPDQRITIEEELASGDRVAVQVSWTATQQGPFLGIPPSGKGIVVAGTGIFRVVDGKITDEWMQEDFLGIYQQLTQG
jgi:steroid delta-isomerase-like uncharacterized protein